MKEAKIYLINCLKSEFETDDTQTAIACCQARFTNEYHWRVDQVGQIKALTDWLQGLAINIAFYNDEILHLARSWGSLPANATERQEDKILDNYWNFMANNLNQLFTGYRIPKECK